VAVVDIRVRRIPNPLTATLALIGLVASALGAATAGMGSALVALLVGFLVWLPFHVLGWVGAGDVKLFAAASAWLTPTASLLASINAAIAGGVLAVGCMIYARGVRFTVIRVLHALRRPRVLLQPLPALPGRDARVPYGVAMGIGLIVQAWQLWISSPPSVLR
jgi:prepilin peptidase CpaA